MSSVPIMLDIIPDPNKTFIGLLDLPERCSIATVPRTLDLWWNIESNNEQTTVTSGWFQLRCRQMSGAAYQSLDCVWFLYILCIYIYTYMYLVLFIVVSKMPLRCDLKVKMMEDICPTWIFHRMNLGNLSFQRPKNEPHALVFRICLSCLTGETRLGGPKFTQKGNFGSILIATPIIQLKEKMKFFFEPWQKSHKHLWNLWEMRVRGHSIMEI